MQGLPAAGVIALVAALSASYAGILAGGKPQLVRREQFIADSSAIFEVEEDQDRLTEQQAAAILQRLAEEADRPQHVSLLEEAKTSNAGSASLGKQVSAFFQDEDHGFVQWLLTLPEDVLGKDDTRSEALSQGSDTSDDLAGVLTPPTLMTAIARKKKAFQKFLPIKLPGVPNIGAIAGGAKLPGVPNIGAIAGGIAGKAKAAVGGGAGKATASAGAAAGKATAAVGAGAGKATAAAGAPAATTSAQDPLKDAQKVMEKKLEEAKKDQWQVTDVYTLWQKVNKTFDCIQKFAAPKYHPRQLLAFFQKVRNNGTDWELVADHFFKHYVKPAIKDITRIQKVLLTGKKLRKIKKIVQGNLAKFTAEDLLAADWVEPIADSIYGIYLDVVGKKGLEPLMCMQRHLIGDAFLHLKLVVLTLTKDFVHIIKKHWDLLLPQAMKWIVKRMVEFLSTNPQDLVMLTHAVNYVADVCLSRWKTNQARVKEYIALRKAGKATKDGDYMGTLSIVRQTFLPNSKSSQGAVAVSGVSTLAAQGGAALRGFVRLLEPRLMNAAVAPVTGVMVDLVRSIAGSTLQLIDGMLGFIPYVGTAISQILSQVMWASANFVVARLEELTHRSVLSVFTSVRKNAAFIAGVVVREFSEEQNVQNTLNNFERNGMDTSVKAGFENENARAEGSESVVNTIFKELKNKHLKVLSPIALDMMGMLRSAFPGVHKSLADCDSMSLVLADTFAVAKP